LAGKAVSDYLTIFDGIIKFREQENFQSLFLWGSARAPFIQPPSFLLKISRLFSDIVTGGQSFYNAL
jgi:hypothetical protein